MADTSAPATAQSAATLKEIIPDSKTLASSMRVIPPASASAAQTSAQLPALVQAACIPVAFRPDAQRANTTLVDLSGDGLIVSAVPNAHIQAVFMRAGYNEVTLSQPTRWCISQAATRELVQLPGSFVNQAATRLVQVGQSWQLMSHEQWTAHQASLRPVLQEPVTASTPLTIPVASAAASSTRKATEAKPAKRRPAQVGSVTSLVQRLGQSSKQMAAQANTLVKP